MKLTKAEMEASFKKSLIETEKIQRDIVIYGVGCSSIGEDGIFKHVPFEDMFKHVTENKAHYEKTIDLMKGKNANAANSPKT